MLHRASWLAPHRLALSVGAFLAGTAWQLQQAVVLGWPVAAGLILLASMLVAIGRCWSGTAVGRSRWVRRVQGLLLGVALFLLGLALTDLRAEHRLRHALPAALEGQDLQVTGVIVGLPRVTLQGTYFDLAVESARGPHGPVPLPPRLSLGWFAGWDGETLLAAPAQALLAGDRWQMTVRLKRPHGPQNPHGFDLELWLFERGIGATGSVRPGARWLAGGVAVPVDRLRQRARDAILMRVADPAAAGVLAALAVGDQAAIEREDWEVFRLTGVAHLMSISGLHVTAFAWLATVLVGHLWRRWPRAMLVLPAPTVARWGGVALALGYALVAGWGVPAQRTVLMLVVVAALRSLGWRWPWPLVWLLAGAAVLLADPWAMLQPGFWLSFGAVGLLMASEPAQRSGPRRWGWRGLLAAGLRTQAVATIGLAPLSMVFFQQVSVVGALANLIAIPWVTAVVMPLSLLGLVLPPLWTLGAWAVQLLMAALEPLSAWPLAVWSAAAAPVWAVLLGLLGGAVLIVPLPWRWRLLGLPMVLPLLAPAVARPAPGDVHILAADIGQGTAVLVRTHGHLLVFDTGPRTSPGSDAGSRVLVPLLRARGERVIDRLVLSHRDTDHIGGAESLLRALPVRESLSSLEDGHPLLPALPGHQRCAAGQRWVWDGVSFEVLHPVAEDYARAVSSNAMSCVIRVTDGQGRRLLLTGDIEAAQEAELLARWPSDGLRATWLQLPHHGSRTSSTAPFLAAVAAQQALVQAGYRSRYGHPAPDVEQRVRDHGAAVVRSDRCGAWLWPSADRAPGLAGGRRASQGVDPGRCERQYRRRYWHHPGAP